MEPFNAIADVRESSVTIISGHQNPAGVANAVAETLDVDPMTIEVNSPRSGGGFGRRFSTDFVREAAVVSKELKQAVKITWTREDEIAQDQFGPGLVSRVKAGIDKNGKLTSLHIRQAKKRGGLWAQCFPAHLIPNYRAEVFAKDCGAPLGPWRGPGHLQFAFATESMIDEVATFLGSDPLAYRLQLMGEDRDFDYTDYGAEKISSGRMAKCYQAAADLADWGKARPEGVGLGIAGHFTFGSYAAFVVEVDARENGSFKVTEAWGAIDCGMPVNPNHIRNQMEGGFIDGLNAAMFNEITIEHGRVSNTNFHALPWMRMAQAPRSIETAIVKNDYPPTGVGEPPTAPAAAALANAIFAATGQRLRKLPLTLQV
jgi:isoquinoline 1-oxidoreductase beta subunit